MNQDEQDLGLVVVDAALMPASGPVVPKVVSRRRGMQALFLKYGITEEMVLAKIAEIVMNPADQYMAVTEFKTSQTFEIQRPLVVSMCDAMQLDRPALFILASQLP
jgi:hypothetical protein